MTSWRLKARLEEVGPGDWFVPVTIKGVDQQAFLSRAIEQGAAGFFYEPSSIRSEDLPPTGSRVAVRNLRETLFMAAECWRSRLNSATFTALTGSNGKTTVKEMITALLSVKAPVLSTRENLNTKIDIASALLRMNTEFRFGVFEVGARQTGDLSRPLRMIRPQIACCLNIGEAHGGEFGGLENLARTKLEIFVPAEELRAVVANADDERIVRAADQSGHPVISFSAGSARADVSLKSFELCPASWTTRLQLEVRGRSWALQVQGCHRALALNACAATAIALAHDFGFEEVEQGFRRFRPPPRRFQRIVNGRRCVVDDSFNANPTGVKSGLLSFRDILDLQGRRGSRKTGLVLGDMLELGADSDSFHDEIGAFVGRYFPESALVTVGQAARRVADGAAAAGLALERICSFPDVEALLADPPKLLFEADDIYLKGSKSLDLGRLATMLCESEPLTGPDSEGLPAGSDE